MDYNCAYSDPQQEENMRLMAGLDALFIQESVYHIKVIFILINM